MLTQDFFRLIFEAKSKPIITKQIIDTLSKTKIELDEDDIVLLSRYSTTKKTLDYKIYIMATQAKISKNFEVLEYIMSKLLINSKYIEDFKKFFIHNEQENYLKPFLNYLLNSKATYIDASKKWELFSEMLFNECFKNNRDPNNLSIADQQTHNKIKNHVINSLSIDNNQKTIKQIIDEFKEHPQSLVEEKDVSSINFQCIKTLLIETDFGSQLTDSKVPFTELIPYIHEVCATGVINNFLINDSSSFTL